MNTHTGKFFEVTAKVLQTQEDGNEKKNKQTIVVEAYSFGEAEQNACQEFSAYSKEYDVDGITPAAYSEIFMSSQDKDDKFFKCKIDYITIDEANGREKKTRICLLANADTTNTAQQMVDKYMKESLSDYSVVAIVETKILDCYFK